MKYFFIKYKIHFHLFKDKVIECFSSIASNLNICIKQTKIKA